MNYFAVKYLSYIVLVFGLMYISWHMGRAFERAHRGGVVRAADRANVTECSEMRDEIKVYRRVYQEVLKELRDPMPPEHWKNEYLAYTKR